MFTGKRTDRLRLPKQLRFPTDLAFRIRAMAQMNRRSIEFQVLHLIEQGIRFEENGKGYDGTNSHRQSHEGTSGN